MPSLTLGMLGESHTDTCTRACSRCGEAKPILQFARKSTGKDGRASHCVACQKLYWDDYYRNKKNRDRHVERTAAANRIRRANVRSLVQRLKSIPCKDCGGIFPYYVMQFDHLPGHRKVGSVANLVTQGLSEERVLEEIAKCEVVCANCHCERTHQRRCVEGSTPSLSTNARAA